MGPLPIVLRSKVDSDFASRDILNVVRPCDRVSITDLRSASRDRHSGEKNKNALFHDLTPLSLLGITM